MPGIGRARTEATGSATGRERVRTELEQRAVLEQAAVQVVAVVAAVVIAVMAVAILIRIASAAAILVDAVVPDLSSAGVDRPVSVIAVSTDSDVGRRG